MLDGLDETEPELRDRYVLPWLREICGQYPNCHYLVSSRPVGYKPGALRSLGFVDADLIDFDEPEIAEYTRHWCTAIRLAQNEPETEARREGVVEGERIVQSFRDHPFISSLARNPLMLSAICLVNYFERGKLPEDRAVLYGLCVEGLLHHWDQRRGIQSDFTLEEKLRTCREVALAMQADDRAEYPVERVREVFIQALGDASRAEDLLEHVRFRTGLLLERRAGIFAFAHLTFQEYLAARAIHEGNHQGIDVERLVREHEDARWREVIALYCGLIPAPLTRKVLEELMAQEDSPRLPDLLADAYLSAGPELAADQMCRREIIERIAALRVFGNPVLHRFSPGEVAPIANARLGKGKIAPAQQAIGWLSDNPSYIDWVYIESRIACWRETDALELADLMYLAHELGPDSLLLRLREEPDLYAAIGPTFEDAHYLSQAEVALVGFSARGAFPPGAPGFDAVLLQVLRTLAKRGIGSWSPTLFRSESFGTYTPQDPRLWKEYVALARRIAEMLSVDEEGRNVLSKSTPSKHLSSWADALERKQTSGTRARKRPTSRKR